MADDPKLNVDASFDEKKTFRDALKDLIKGLKGTKDAVDDTSKASTKGFKGMSDGAGRAAEAFVESYLVYKATGSKIAAVFQALSFAIQERLIGKLTLAAGLAYGAMRGITALSNRLKDATIGAAAGIEQLVTEFTPLLGSLEAAKQRVDELQSFAVGTPYELEDLIMGNKVLEATTRGALTTKEGMTMVGDAASVAGVAFEEMARNVGRLYDSLQSGRAPGFAALRLQELGLLSGTARTKLSLIHI